MVMPDKGRFLFQLCQSAEEIFLALPYPDQVFPFHPVFLLLFFLGEQADDENPGGSAHADPDDGHKSAGVISLPEIHAIRQPQHIKQNHQHGRGGHRKAFLSFCSLSSSPGIKQRGRKFQPEGKKHRGAQHRQHGVFHMVHRFIAKNDDVDKRAQQVRQSLHHIQQHPGPDPGFQAFPVQGFHHQLHQDKADDQAHIAHNPGSGDPAQRHGGDINAPDQQHLHNAGTVFPSRPQHDGKAEAVNDAFQSHDKLLQNKVQSAHASLPPSQTVITAADFPDSEDFTKAADSAVSGRVGAFRSSTCASSSSASSLWPSCSSWLMEPRILS